MAAGPQMSTFPVQTVSIEGRGRGLFATRDINAGETVLQEAPVMLIPSPDCLGMVCSQCLRRLCGNPAEVACPIFPKARFCSQECYQLANQPTGNHSPIIARCLAQGDPSAANSEQIGQLHYLYHALALKIAAQADPAVASAYQGLLSLVGDVTAGMEPPVSLHHALGVIAAAAGVEASPPMSLEEVAALLKKEELNSYGVMAPSAEGGERRIRGSGVYVNASLINHECLPNVTRFDNFDAPGPHNMIISQRALHAIPAGSEILQSYFPLNWGYRERQDRCKDQYGFVCSCPRCTLEAKYDDDDEEEDAAKPSGAATADAKGKGAMASDEYDKGEAPELNKEDDMQDTYQYLFLEKHICPQEDCYGTMAPITAGADVLECNMCGHRRTEAEFLAELELQERTDEDEDYEDDDMDG